MGHIQREFKSSLTFVNTVQNTPFPNTVGAMPFTSLEVWRKDDFVWRLTDDELLLFQPLLVAIFSIKNAVKV